MLAGADEAITLIEKAVTQAREVGGIFAEGLAQRSWGQALAAAHPPAWDRAEEHLAISLRRFEEGEARLEAARTQVAWGLLCRDRGDSAGALNHLERAVTQFEASELAVELERTRSLLRDLAKPRSEMHPDSLTLREMEVLRLIAAGRTNQEIAAQLVISVPTVARHITNIYGKIGARRRADATSYALSHGLVQGRRS